MVTRPGSMAPQATGVPPLPVPDVEPPAPVVPVGDVDVAPPEPGWAVDELAPIVPVHPPANPIIVASVSAAHRPSARRWTVLPVASDVMAASTRTGPCGVQRDTSAG